MEKIDRNQNYVHQGGVYVLSNPLRWTPDELIKNVAFCRQLVPLVRRLLWFIYECGEDEFLTHRHLDVLNYLYTSVGEVVDVCDRADTLEVSFIPLLSLDRIPLLVQDARNEVQWSAGYLAGDFITHDCHNHMISELPGDVDMGHGKDKQNDTNSGNNEANVTRDATGDFGQRAQSFQHILRPTSTASTSYMFQACENGVEIDVNETADEDIVFFSNPIDSKIAHKCPQWSVSLSMKIDSLSPRAAHLSLRRVSSTNDSFTLPATTDMSKAFDKLPIGQPKITVLGNTSFNASPATTISKRIMEHQLGQPSAETKTKMENQQLEQPSAETKTKIDNQQLEQPSAKTSAEASVKSNVVSSIDEQTLAPQGTLTPVHSAVSDESSLFELPTIPPELTPEHGHVGKFRQYSRVLFAGTFDHLHSGHKTLLTFAAYMTRNTLIIGVTTEALQHNKHHQHLIEPYFTRALKVKNFLKLIKPTLVVEFTPLSDVIGPSGEIILDAIIVTKETMAGGEAVNRARRRNCLPPVKIVQLDLISRSVKYTSIDDNENTNEIVKSEIATKLSSSYIREILVRHSGNPEILSYSIDHWTRLANLCCVPQELAVEIIVRLLRNYAEPWRHTMGLIRVYRLLSLYDLVATSTINNPAVVLFVIWFHNAVYCTRLESTNRIRCGSLFVLFSKRWKHWLRIDSGSNSGSNIERQRQCIDQISDTVVQYILTLGTVDSCVDLELKFTANNRSTEWINDLLWLLDLDRCMFATSEDEYMCYIKEVRQEYFYLDADQYNRRRLNYLEDLISLPKLYTKLPSTYEDAARRNITSEIENLKNCTLSP